METKKLLKQLQNRLSYALGLRTSETYKLKELNKSLFSFMTLNLKPLERVQLIKDLEIQVLNNLIDEKIEFEKEHKIRCLAINQLTGESNPELSQNPNPDLFNQL